MNRAPIVRLLAVSCAILALGAVWTGTSDAAVPSFTRTDYPVAGSPLSIATADFNRDGVLDLAVTSGANTFASVLLGNPDGTFGPRADFQTGGGPYFVAAGDVSLDGIPDLLVANIEGKTISVLLGIGNGSFAPAMSYDAQGDGGPGGSEVPYGPAFVGIADLNRDGRPDAVASAVTEVIVRLGNGDGTFGPQIDFPVNGRVDYSILTTDLNHDGLIDLAFGNRILHTVSIRLGNGNGTFQPQVDYPIANIPYFVDVADLNGDTHPDLVFSTNPVGGSTVSVLLGRGDGTFLPETNFETGYGTSGVKIGDFNSDQIPDIAAACYWSNSLDVLVGRGDGTFEPRVAFAGGGYCHAVALGDWDRDGRLDAAVTDQTRSQIYVFRNVPGEPPGSPVLAPIGNKTVDELTTLTFTATATDPDAGQTLTFSLASGAPAGATINASTGVFSWTPTEAQGPVAYPITVRVTDSGSPPLSDSEPITVHVREVNVAPILMPIGDKSATIGSPITFTAIATDSDVPPNFFTFSLDAGAPSGATINASTGAFSWTPSTSGSFPVTVRVTDRSFPGVPPLSDFETITVTVGGGGASCSVAMGFDLTPDMLNLRSMGLWVTAFLEPPAPFTPVDIDVPSVRLNGTVVVDPTAPVEIGDHDSDGIADLMVKFDRAAMELTVSEGDIVAVTVNGTVMGQCFNSTDYIRVLRARVSEPAAGSTVSPGTTTTMRWTTPSGINIQSVAVLSSLDGGASWNLEANGLPNSGAYDWMVPNVTSDNARMAVVLVETADESGYLVDGVLGTSGTFSIGNVTGVEGGAKLEFALERATPNPMQGALRVTFSLPDALPATVEVFNVSGRRVAAREVGSFGPGSHTVTLGDRATFPSGVYFVRLRQAGRSLTMRTVVVR
jgi:FG-GAP-like repeat/Putative Ig domain